MFALTLTASLLVTSTPLKLASPGWSYINVDDKKGDFFADYFAQQLAVRGFTVTTKSEISSLIGFERQKQLMGCSTDSSNCIAELAGALGVDGLITGSLAKFKSGYTVNIKVVAAGNAKQLAVDSGSAKDDDALIEWLREAAETMAPKLQQAAKVKPEEQPQVVEKPKADPEPVAKVDSPPEVLTPPPEVEETKEPSSGVRVFVLLPAVTGALFIGGGTFALLQAKGINDELRNPNSSYWDATSPSDSVARARSEARRGELMQTIGLVGVGVGAAAVATAVVLALQVEPDATIAASATSEGGSVSVGGRF